MSWLKAHLPQVLEAAGPVITCKEQLPIVLFLAFIPEESHTVHAEQPAATGDQYFSSSFQFVWKET